MGHEVALATARHSAERLSQKIAMQYGLQAAGATSEMAAANIELLAQAATLGVILPFSRDQESEADEIGLIYMARAGYDPRAAVALWRNMQTFAGSVGPEFLSTHPSTGNRIAELEAAMPRALAIYQANSRSFDVSPSFVTSFGKCGIDRLSLRPLHFVWSVKWLTTHAVRCPGSTCCQCRKCGGQDPGGRGSFAKNGPLRWSHGDVIS